jgi:hypothetical protein|nr:MAG TPA: hypothetical protein [Bacteriophage sp.]
MSIDRAQLWDQIKLESNDGFFSTDKSRTKNAINTSHRLFENSLARKDHPIKWSSNIYRKNANTDYADVRRMMDAVDPLEKGSIGTALKAEAITNSRNRTAAERIFGAAPGSSKFNSTQPVRGGGINNMYAFNSFESFTTAGMSDHLGRASKFAMGYGLRDDLMNSVGLMTKHQKSIISSASTKTSDKLFTGMAPIMGGVFALTEASDYIFGNKESTITDNAATSIAGMALTTAAGTYGFRVGKELTHSATSLLKGAPIIGKIGRGAAGEALGWAGRARGVAKLATGTVGGLVAGGGLMWAADTAIGLAKSLADRDNRILQVRNSLFTSGAGNTSVNTQQLATSRQRAFAKLSKSSLNDKGYILGNEAAILKGIF